MNSYERVMARLQGKEVDRIPNLCILMAFVAKYANVCYRDFCLVPEKMVEANLLCVKDFGVDVVTVMSDAYGEAQDYGAQVTYPYDSLPICETPFLQQDKDVFKLKLKHSAAGSRMGNRMETIRLYEQKVKRRYPIVGWVEGAVAEFVVLRGMTNAMIDFLDKPQWVHDVLEVLTQQAIIYIKEQINAGADIIGVGDAAASLLSPDLYETFALPYQKRLIGTIQSLGGKSKLHICGNTNHVLHLIAKTGTDIFDADWQVDLPTAVQKLQGISVSGNFDPVQVVLRGSPETIMQAVRTAVFEGNEKTMISAGCEIPPQTPHENLLTIHHTLKNLV